MAFESYEEIKKLHFCCVLKLKTNKNVVKQKKPGKTWLLV